MYRTRRIVLRDLRGLPKHCRVRLGCATATQGVPGRLAACDRGGVKNVWFGVGPTTQPTPFHHSGALEPPGANLELHKFAVQEFAVQELHKFAMRRVLLGRTHAPGGNDVSVVVFAPLRSGGVTATLTTALPNDVLTA